MCGCPPRSHRSPAESPLHVAIPGARKDADPSRRLESRPLHPPGPVVPKHGRRTGRRSGEGDHKGRPYESFDSGDAVGAADGQSCPVSRGIMPEARRWGTSEKDMGHPRRGDILVPLFAAVAFAGHRWGRSWADRRGDFQSPRGSGGRKTPTPSFSRRISPDRGRWGSSYSHSSIWFLASSMTVSRAPLARTAMVSG